MGLREKILKTIENKEKEARELKAQLRDCQAYIQGQKDILKLVPKEIESEQEKEIALRPGSMTALSRQAILKAGKPLHVSEILKLIGKPNEKKLRVSLSGSLSAYVRGKKIFTKPYPNTFGLVEMEESRDDPEGKDHDGLEMGKVINETKELYQ